MSDFTTTRTVLFLFLFQLIIIMSSTLVLVVFDEFYPGEQAGLLQLKDSLTSSSFPKWHAAWAGPPCYYNSSKWPGIACSDGHVVHLVLQRLGLSGSLPPTFLHNLTFINKLSFSNNFIYGRLPNLTGLSNVETLFLSQNHFSDSIPSNYVALPKLRMLELQHNFKARSILPFNQPILTLFNVSYNHLEGPIPNTNVLQGFPTSCYDHNSNLCGAPLRVSCSHPVPSPDNKKKKNNKSLKIALITAAASLIPFLVVFIFLLCYYKKILTGKETKTRQQAGVRVGEGLEKAVYRSGSTDDPERTKELELLSKDVSVFDLGDLLRASAQLLGKGNLGTTYQAILESGSTVVVKRLTGMNEVSKKEFAQQMQVLGKLRHDNVVDVISYYYAAHEKLIIYGFVPHGTLFHLLHENRGVGRVGLPWGARLSIIKDIAEGMAYLHESLASHKAPHANLKSSNVLIYHNYRAKITDMGFLPLLDHPMEKLAAGRTSDEWKKVTHKTDVYCFGIILLEVITGRNPGEANKELSGWVSMVVETDDWSTDIIDLEIVGNRQAHDDMFNLTQLALHCAHLNPHDRPTMNQVLTRLQQLK